MQKIDFAPKIETNGNNANNTNNNTLLSVTTTAIVVGGGMALMGCIIEYIKANITMNTIKHEFDEYTGGPEFMRKQREIANKRAEELHNIDIEAKRTTLEHHKIDLYMKQKQRDTS